MKNFLTQAELRAWSTKSRLMIVSEVRRNLSGRVLKVVTGRLRDNIATVSRVTRDGFTIGTNVFYGIAWELGFHRKAYVINPRNEGGVLRWIDRPTGKAFFAKYVFIPAQTFPARSFIRTAVDAKLPKICEDLGRRVVKKVGDDLPNTFEVTVGTV